MPQTEILGWAAPGVPRTRSGATFSGDVINNPIGPVGAYGGTLGAALVPNVMGLETQSSKDIGELLNPPSVFPDVSRQAGELAAARGIPGTAAAAGTGLRMTDEERLRRIALGENLLSGAYGRTLPYAITPEQTFQNQLAKDRLALDQSRLDWEQNYQQQQLNRLNTPTVRYGGGLPQYPLTGGSTSTGGSTPFWDYNGPPITDFHGTGETPAYNTGSVGGYTNQYVPQDLPLYPGTGVGDVINDYEGAAGVYAGYSGDSYLDWIYGG